MVKWFKKKEPEQGGFCVEDPDYAETRKKILFFERKFYIYVLVSIIYGLFFVNFIDVIVVGSSYNGYHLWLVIMYFFPFVALTLAFPRNWTLTLGLGLLTSLMNDVFYGIIRYAMGYPLDLVKYYTYWLVPGNQVLFGLNLGFTVIIVYSWLMALTIYLRVIIVVLLLKAWKQQAKIRCLTDKGKKKDPLAWLKK